MRDQMDRGATENAAAVIIARKHHGDITPAGYEAAVQWLKRNQRKHRDELRGSGLRRRLREARSHDPNWIDEANQQYLSELNEMTRLR